MDAPVTVGATSVDACSSLQAAADHLGLLLPGAGERSGLGAVLPAVAGALAAAGAAEPSLAQGAAWGAALAALGLPAADRVCVVLVDGLGHLNLTERSGHAPFLRAASAGSVPLSSTFPSTTATALGTFGVAQPPGRTGMLGYTVRDPATGTLGNLVSWTDLPEPEHWQPHPSVLEALAAVGATVTSIGPRRFAGSGLTRAALRGAAYVPAEPLAARVDAAVRAARAPGLTYLYWGDVDKAGHHHGVGSWQWGDALAEADAEIGRLARSLPRGTVLLVTADHGMVDVDRTQRWDVAHDDRLVRDVALVAGEPRASHLHLEPGADAERVRDVWGEVLGDSALVLTRDEAVSGGLFGAVDDRVRPIVGDVVVAMAGRATVVDSRTQTPASLELVGVHGSLTPHEMLVPCIVVA